MKTKFQKDRAFHKIVQCIKSCTTVKHVQGCIKMISLFKEQFAEINTTLDDAESLIMISLDKVNQISKNKLCSTPVN